MLASEVLRKARKLIERPEAWTKGACGRGTDGLGIFRTNAGYPNAVSWCSIGAVVQSVPIAVDVQNNACEFLARAAGFPRGTSVIIFAKKWNDAPDRKHADVISNFDRAIELAENEERRS